MRSVWNGPFNIGKLSQPVSVGDVFLKVLETAWRSVVAVFAILLILGVAGLTWVQVLEPALFPPLKNGISAHATYDVGKQPLPPKITTVSEGSTNSVVPIAPLPKINEDYENVRCSPEHPILIEFDNKSGKTVRNIFFEVEAYASGRSTNLVRDSWLNNDSILIPGFREKSCWHADIDPGFDPSVLSYVVKITSAD